MIAICAMDRRIFACRPARSCRRCPRRREEKKKRGGHLCHAHLLGTMIGQRPAGVLSVDCGLDVPDAGCAAGRPVLPRLRAAFVQTVQSYAAGLSSGALPNADYIAATLQRQTDTILGRPGARVLLGAIIAN
jgi:hypothetical protein